MTSPIPAHPTLVRQQYNSITPQIRGILISSFDALTDADALVLPGKHWSAEKVANTFTPHPETKNAVMDWLEASGITRDRLSLSTGECPTRLYSRMFTE